MSSAEKEEVLANQLRQRGLSGKKLRCYLNSMAYTGMTIEELDKEDSDVEPGEPAEEVPSDSKEVISQKLNAVKNNCHLRYFPTKSLEGLSDEEVKLHKGIMWSNEIPAVRDTLSCLDQIFQHLNDVIPDIISLSGPDGTGFLPSSGGVGTKKMFRTCLSLMAKEKNLRQRFQSRHLYLIPAIEYLVFKELNGYHTLSYEQLALLLDHASGLLKTCDGIPSLVSKLKASIIGLRHDQLARYCRGLAVAFLRMKDRSQDDDFFPFVWLFVRPECAKDIPELSIPLDDYTYRQYAEVRLILKSEYVYNFTSSLLKAFQTWFQDCSPLHQTTLGVCKPNRHDERLGCFGLPEGSTQELFYPKYFADFGHRVRSDYQSGLHRGIMRLHTWCCADSLGYYPGEDDPNERVTFVDQCQCSGIKVYLVPIKQHTVSRPRIV